MDKDRAKFILGSFRPDGADVEDGDFAEALKLATSDRELGEWLVKERAFDAEFAECLARVDLPEGLRASVLLAMVQNGSDFPRADLEDERFMVKAIASIKAPQSLRANIIEAMEQTSMTAVNPSVWTRFGMPLAAAAGIVLAFSLFTENEGSETPGKIVGGPSVNLISVDAVQSGFVRTFESPIFSLDHPGTSQKNMIVHLKEKGLPCGDMDFPPGLEHLKGLGCRELVVDGKRGSLICLDEEGGTVHLIIFMRRDVGGDLPDIENPNISQDGDWAKASWGNEKYVFTLMALRDSGEMKRLF